MNLEYRKDVSFSLSAYFLKLVGVWSFASRKEKWFRNVMTMNVIASIITCVYLQVAELCVFWGDLTIVTYIMCNILVLIADLFKLLILSVHKKKFFNLIASMQKNFWHLNYDRYEHTIIANAKRTSIYFVCGFSFFSQSTVICYIIKPLIANIGKNESDRELISNVHLDLPLTMSPYFEITYTIEALMVYLVGVCYLCFDNIFCVICLHVAGQFRILQYRMANMPHLEDRKSYNENWITDRSNQCYVTLKDYIQQHRVLIEFCSTLEEIFSLFILGQVITFSIVICFVGYQAFMVNLTIEWRVSFVCFSVANIWQLWIFTHSCDCVARESLNVAWAVYTGPWIHLPMDKFGRMIRKDLQVVVMRAMRASHLTTCGFFPVSIETFTKIMSTAMSYFTILKQNTVNAIDT